MLEKTKNDPAVMYDGMGTALNQATLVENLQPGAKHLSVFNEIFPLCTQYDDQANFQPGHLCNL